MKLVVKFQNSVFMFWLWMIMNHIYVTQLMVGGWTMNQILNLYELEGWFLNQTG